MIKLPNANLWQGYQISAYLKTGKGTYKEIIYRKVRDQKGNAIWQEVKA